MSDVDEQLERERRGAPLAFIGAILAAILPMAGAIAAAGILADQPENSPGKLLYFDKHAGTLILSSVLLSLGALALLFPLRHLFMATKARRPALPRVALVCAVAGCLLLAAGQVASQLILTDKASTFATVGNQTYPEARDVLESGELRALAAGLLAAQLALGFAFVITSLNAMRAGLLTKFMGILGIIVGVLFVIPLAPGPPVVQSFWLGALAALFAGKWPSGVPPAWTTGKAVPWPSQQEVRERRQRMLDERRAASAGGPVSEPEAGAAAGAAASAAPHPASSKKRKRKKRS